MAVTDNFTGTDDATLDSAKWAVLVGTAVYKNNHVQVALSALTFVKWVADSFNPDQRSKIVRIDDNSYIGPAVRLTGTGGTTCGYYFQPHPSSCFIYRLDNGVGTDITNGPNSGIGFPATFDGNPHAYYFDIVDDDLVVREDDPDTGTILATATSSTYGSGQPGFWGYDTTTQTRGDDWEGTGETGGGGGTVIPVLMNLYRQRR